MSEIRPSDINEANAFGRTTVFPRAKLVGEGDGHECPSYAELQTLLTYVDPCSTISLAENSPVSIHSFGLGRADGCH